MVRIPVAACRFHTFSLIPLGRADLGKSRHSRRNVRAAWLSSHYDFDVSEHNAERITIEAEFRVSIPGASMGLQGSKKKIPFGGGL